MVPDTSGPISGVSGSPAIRMERLTKRLRNGIVAVDRLDLEVSRGAVMALIGPNGSGKTITLRMLLGLVRPTTGRVLIFDEEVRPGANVLGRVGALVDGPGFVPHLTGRRNLELAVRLIRLSGGSVELDAAVEMTGLGEAIDRAYSGYSHGMRYRLAIAQALLGSPELLVLDEPTTGMDPTQAHEVHGAISTCAAAGTTVILSSHSMSEIELVCSHAAILRSGRLLASGSIGDLVGTTPKLIVDVDDPDQARHVLGGLAGFHRISVIGLQTIVIEGNEFGATAIIERLDREGVHVLGFRFGSLEDSYLALLEGASGRDAVTDDGSS